MQREKTLGKLDGIPDVEAYRQIIEYMHKSVDIVDYRDNNLKQAY